MKLSHRFFFFFSNRGVRWYEDAPAEQSPWDSPIHFILFSMKCSRYSCYGKQWVSQPPWTWDATSRAWIQHLAQVTLSARVCVQTRLRGSQFSLSGDAKHIPDPHVGVVTIELFLDKYSDVYDGA